MRFLLVSPCSGSASYCGPRIMGIGSIAQDTHQKFVAFVTSAKQAGELPPTPTVSLHSYGGNLLGGLRLGQAIRDAGFNTMLEPEYTRLVRGTLTEETLIEEAVCASACALAFLGGVNRDVSKGSRYGVHQFFSPEKSTGDESVAQLLPVLIAAFVESMGAKRQLVDLASLTPVSRIRWLSDEELKQFSVTTNTNSLSAWSINSDENGVPSVSVVQRISTERVLGIRIRMHETAFMLLFALRFDKALANRHRLSMFMSDGGPGVNLDVGRSQVELTPTTAWRRIEDATSVVFAGAFTAPTSLLSQVEAAPSIRVWADLHPAYRDVTLDTELSSVGLQEGLALLTRVR